MAIGVRTRRWLMWAAWTVLCLASAMYAGLIVGRPLYYSDGGQQVAGADMAGSGMLRWTTPAAERELPVDPIGRVASLPDGALLFGMASEAGTSDLYTWHPDNPDVPPEPAYGLNTEHNELAPAVGPDSRVYFASDRPDAIGGYDLFATTWTPRGFGRVEPVAACNTAFDETDPAPDPVGASLVFVRIDRAIDDGNDGVLYRWLLGDPLDPDLVFPEQARRRERVVDRDPAFAPNGASLWFVRKVRGRPLQVCRTSRLGDAFDHPVELSAKWGTRSLRSPLPLADGQSVAFVQPAVGEDPALWFVSHAEELVPWWPGQHWLEYLCLSLIGCAALLLLLLYFGQRWSALDLVAQCLLLSLLLHILLFLWLMGVEIAGSLLPGSDDDDSGMQVSIVAAAGVSTASSAGGAGDIAAKVQRTVRERSFEVAEPGTATARSQLDARRSLAVDNGSYEAEPTADADAQAESAQLDDAAAAMTKRDGADAVAELSQAAMGAVEQVQQSAEAAAARSVSADPNADARVVQVQTPGSGVSRAAPRAVEIAQGDATAAIPVRSSPSNSTSPDAPAMQDAASAAALASAEQRVDAGPARVGMTSEASLSAAPTSAAVAAPQRGAKKTSDDAVAVAMPGSTVGRSNGRQIAAQPAARQVAVSGPRSRSKPTMQLRGERAAGGAAAARSESAGPAPTAAVAAVDVAAPTIPDAATVRAARTARAGERPSPRESLAAPGSALRRSKPIVAMRGPTMRSAPKVGLRGGARVALKDPGARERGAEKPATKAGSASATAQVVAAAQDLPDQPTSNPSFAPRRARPARSTTPGAFAARFPVQPPGTRIARAAARPSALPQPSQPAVAKNAYSNRFGPAKARALERFGGSEETERAVRDGLAYLASIQNRDGSWGNRRDYDRKYGFVYVGKTALCVLAFLGAGHTPESNTEYSPRVARALEHLLALQDEDTGAFGRSSCYGHGITTYALAECYGLTKNEELLRPLEDALTWILANQGPRRDQRNRGGWGYFSPGLRAEDSYARVSVSSWMIMALESARMSGIELPEDVLPSARQYLQLSYDRPNGWFRYNHKPSRLRSGWPTLPASTPAAAFCLMLLGVDKDDRMVDAAAEYTAERRPRQYRRYRDDDFVLRGQGNVYFWYYGSLCCFLKGGREWERWNERLSTVLPQAQNEDGSWTPIDVYSEEAGDNRRDRSYTTAMCVLSLEVYYRYFTPLLLGR